MSKSWNSGVKGSGKLTVYNGLVGKWANIYKLALESFNKLKLNVTVATESNEKQANVVMLQSNGTAAYDYDGQTFTKVFSGTALHGYTMQLSRDNIIEKAVVFLPANPQNTIGYIKGKLETEDVSQDVMLVIAVHELIHACGLEDGDHARDDGIFYFPLGISGKKLIVPEKGKNDRPMPPIVLSKSTINKVQALWS